MSLPYSLFISGIFHLISNNNIFNQESLVYYVSHRAQKRRLALWPRTVNISIYLYNSIFTWGSGGRALTHSEPLRKGVIIMSTYEEMQILLTFALLVVAILTYTHKK